jgi:hypothetical protein
MNAVESFILEQPQPQQRILQYLHELLMAEPEVSCRIRYKIPFYDRKSWICYLNTTKDKGVELAFTRGNELSNVQGLLDFKGRKQVAGITFYQLKDIQEDLLFELLQEAFLLDDMVKYNVRKERK